MLDLISSGPASINLPETRLKKITRIAIDLEREFQVLMIGAINLRGVRGMNQKKQNVAGENGQRGGN
ncbi:hypothetical protein [Photobacterium sp. TY1-4]|uniref:hypothetical protein n=1 Tax=Photobacterium sp. TY1-4 TaxID=2899122 RepID=UPI0021C19758|nr:hypothetical protein [Photobacterium sp. TY1-4]UXI03671.1 hypothetical protein NH461_24980 [Photobacterium sp. TY1-4]